jgi:hypothetical protein
VPRALPLDRGRLRRWRRPAIRALLRGLDAYPALSAASQIDVEMGRRARAHVDTGVYSSSVFAEQMRMIMAGILG